MITKPTTSHLNSAPSTSKRSILSQLPLPETINFDETETLPVATKYGKTNSRELLMSKKSETANEGKKISEYDHIRA